MIQYNQNIINKRDKHHQKGFEQEWTSSAAVYAWEAEK